MQDEDDKAVFRVVVNDEEQYSIWPARKKLPAGWRDAGKQGLKSECLAYVDEVWTDMRPLSLRKTMGDPAITHEQRAAAAKQIAEASGDHVHSNGVGISPVLDKAPPEETSAS